MINMDKKKLNKALKEVKEKANLDYALSRGYYSPTPTNKMISETYGENAIGIFVRWFGKDQEQRPISEIDELYINHDFDENTPASIKKLVFETLPKYYFVDWDYTSCKTIRGLCIYINKGIIYITHSLIDCQY